MVFYKKMIKLDIDEDELDELVYLENDDLDDDSLEDKNDINTQFAYNGE